MKTLAPYLFQVMGTIVNGDIGPYTTYTSARKGFVIFLKTWPKDPATYNQTLNRNRWRHCAQRWRSLDDATRQLWSDISRRASCTVTGYNLFMYYMLNKNIGIIETLERQTGISVIAPTGDPLPYAPV